MLKSSARDHLSFVMSMSSEQLLQHALVGEMCFNVFSAHGNSRLTPVLRNEGANSRRQECHHYPIDRDHNICRYTACCATVHISHRPIPIKHCYLCFVDTTVGHCIIEIHDSTSLNVQTMFMLFYAIKMYHALRPRFHSIVFKSNECIQY